MVKRAIAVVLGAIAGVLLWYLFDWMRSPAEASDTMSIENCLQDGYVGCVEFRTPAQPAPAFETVARPCKDWLGGDAGSAALSRCLHEARRDRDAVRLENFKRAQRIAAAN